MPPVHTAPAADNRPAAGWREQLYIVIFEAETRAGRAFDLALLALILCSVATVMLDSVSAIHARWSGRFDRLEWFFTVAFSIEYILRLLCVRNPWRYARSMLGIIDLLAILPTYLAFLFPELAVLIDVRVLRLMRVFRVLKLAAFVREFSELGNAILATRHKIAVFVSFVLIVVIVLGTLMYVVEGPENGYTSIPVAVYWAITTLTTVGYGDISPKTDLGRLIASAMMLMGWGTLAVPTGIVSAEFAARRMHPEPTTRTCPACLSEGHALAASYCADCGAPLPPAITGSLCGH